ncbi:hypothetical protein P167DRAFT_516853 [Morchella conica CCBAS932]|uniref:SH3 domain-containing protein n=1 Tax=Morchella conica CCBAS932 TaxID=1392247 RepID=A0A3N4LFG5_9PEZI|nr:hypothetical protein P167DRAFT_516853 [Morchella conica CCBAS932]
MSTLSSNRDSFNPQFVSSLSYTSVRDFAYPSLHPLHYGPSIASGLSTPAGSQRGSEYFENTPGGGSSWFTGGGSGYPARQRSTNQPPPLNFSDGPPWSEDEDLQSPVVLPKHRKHKSSAAHMQSNHLRGQSKNAVAPNTSQHFPAGGQEPGDEMYNHEGEGEEEYDPDDPEYNSHQYHYSDEDGHEYDDEEEGEDLYDDEDSRFSRDYQFQITSPDEEMSGKAVALFDFTSENENELPLVEGQIVWVSYRHGQGWLVAQDPRTGDTGLIPEEYVRLFRDAQTSYDRMDPATMTPSSSAESGPLEGELTLDTTGTSTNGQTAPIITTFSTSSQDVYPYQFHYATDHLPENPHHPRSRNSPDFTGDMTPTITSNKERIAQLQREQERAVAEESSTPRLRGQNGVAIIPRLNGGGSDVYYDAPERQGDGFRGKANENNLQVR